MRAPASFSQLAPIAVPGLVLVGALGLLVMATPIGFMVFGGPWLFTLLSIVAGVIVAGYLVTALTESVAGRRAGWRLPPAAHLLARESSVQLPAEAVRRAGFEVDEGPVRVPTHLAYALERSLAGAWGVPEDHWSRTAFLQRLTTALVLAVVFATLFLLGDVLAGQGLSSGMRSHAGTIVLAGSITGWLVAGVADRTRREAVIDLLADARAMVMDRGEHREVRRVLDELGLEIDSGEAEVGVSP